MRTISESLSCNLPRCKGTPERTTCGKKPTRRKGVTTVTEPAFAGKKRMRVRSIARAIVSRPIALRTAFFSIVLSLFLFVFYSIPFIFFGNPRASPFSIRRSSRDPAPNGLFRLRHQLDRPRRRSRECSSQCSAHAITETIDVDTH